MQDKVIVSNHVAIDMTYWICLMLAMPMLFFFAALLNVWRSGLEAEHMHALLGSLAKGMFYCHLFILSIFIGVKKF